MKVSGEGGRKQRVNCRRTSSASHGHDDLSQKEIDSLHEF